MEPRSAPATRAGTDAGIGARASALAHSAWPVRVAWLVMPLLVAPVVDQAVADAGIALASFMPRICGARRTRWGSTLNNLAKTWYVPLLFRPHLFLRGVRLLFGDHAMFFRREQFLAIGGCDERVRPFDPRRASGGSDRPPPGRTFTRKGNSRGLRGRQRGL